MSDDLHTRGLFQQLPSTFGTRRARKPTPREWMLAAYEDTLTSPTLAIIRMRRENRHE